MTLVATPYSIAELSEDEERHEIGNFMDCEDFDVRGYHGEVLIEGTWHTVWQFGTAEEAVVSHFNFSALYIIGTTLEGAASHCGGIFNRPSA